MQMLQLSVKTMPFAVVWSSLEIVVYVCNITNFIQLLLEIGRFLIQLYISRKKNPIFIPKIQEKLSANTAIVSEDHTTANNQVY